MRSLPRIATPGIRSAILFAGAAFVLFAYAASACDTPVFRYAMYHWSPEPYHVYYLYRGEPASKDAEVNRILAQDSPRSAEADAADQTSPNLIFSSVNVDRPEQIESLPEAVKKAKESLGKQELPLHLIFAPWPAQVAAERLDAAAARAMLDSPLRKRIGELFHQGHGAVLLLASGKSIKENQQAETAARDAITRAAAKPASATKDDVADRRAELKPDESQMPPDGDAPEPIKIGLVKLDRSDAAEQWLVRCIAAADAEFRDKPDEARIYPVYGRGRFLPPFVGEAISGEYLDELTSFLRGGCSCTVKEQSPGLDLLMRWDWEATTEALAATDPRRGDVPADLDALDLAAKQQSLPTAAAKPSTPPAAKLAPAKVDAREAPATAARVKLVTAAAISPAAPESQNTPVESSVSEESSPPEPAGSFAVRQMWKFAIGFVAFAAIIFASGLVLVRRAGG